MRKAICLLLLVAFLGIGIEACKKKPPTEPGATPTEPGRPGPRRGEKLPGE